MPDVVVDGSNSDVSVLPRAWMLAKDGEFTPSEAAARLTMPGAQVETVVRSHGYVLDVMWARTTLDVAEQGVGRWYLTLEVPNFDLLDVYRLDPSGSAAPELLFTLGDRTPPVSDIASRFHVAPMDLKAGRLDLLFRAQTTGSMTLDLSLREITALLQEEQPFVSLQTFYLGILVALLLASLVTLVFSHERIYAIYALALVSQAIYWMLVLGTGPGHLWPELAGRLPLDPLMFIPAALAALILFARSFLDDPRMPPAILRAMTVMAFVALCLPVAKLLTPWPYDVYVNMTSSGVLLPSVAALFIPSIIGLFRGVPASRPLCFAWGALSMAATVGFLRDHGLITSSFWVMASPQLGSLAEMLVFGYMLMARWARAQGEKEAIQRQALLAAREQETVLERRVADRTAELNASNALLRLVVGAAPFPLTLSDTADDIVMFANRRAVAFLAPPGGNLLGEPIPNAFLRASDRHAAFDELDRAGAVIEREVEFRSADGEVRWVLLSMLPLVLDGKKIRLTAFNDVTRMKTLEQELRDTAELEAWAADRERAARYLQQQFVAMISHEFRTPLAAIDGAVQNLELSDDRSRVRLDRIRAAVSRLLRMIDICLTDARIQDGELALESEEQDLAALMHEVARPFSPGEGAGEGRVVIRPPAAPLLAEVDEGLIQIALTNLIDNAMKYSPKEAQVIVEGRVSATQIGLAVSDAGPGIPEAERERVFEKYYRAANISGLPGAGLGLHLVRMIMQSHGGNVSYDPVTPTGSRFTLWFPIRAPRTHENNQITQ